MNKEAIVSLVRDMFGIPEAAWVSGVRLTPSMLQKVVDHVIKVEREAFAMACDEEKNKFMGLAGKNNGRESDFAFGSVNSAERIKAKIPSRGDS